MRTKRIIARRERTARSDRERNEMRNWLMSSMIGPRRSYNEEERNCYFILAIAQKQRGCVKLTVQYLPRARFRIGGTMALGASLALASSFINFGCSPFSRSR